MKTIRVLWVGLIVVIAIVVWSGALRPSVQFQPFTLSAFTQSLMPLLVIAVLIERTVAVLFGISIEPKVRALEANVEAARTARVAAQRAVREDGAGIGVYTRIAKAALDAARNTAVGGKTQPGTGAVTLPDIAEEAGRLEADAVVKLEEQRASASPYASLASAALGVVAAIAGVRLLDTLIVHSTPQPETLFRFLDVLLTGGLLGGGADGFRQLTQILKATSEAVQVRARAWKRRHVARLAD